MPIKSDVPDASGADLIPLRVGRDELNLAEFPIALLSSRAGEGQKTLKFADVIIGDKGKPIKREWVVAGSEEFGLPTANDEDVFLALLETTKEAGFASRTVPISRYDIIQRLGLPLNGKSYQRIKDALDRLSSVQVFAKNAFYNRQIGKHTSVSFGILDNYTLTDEVKGRNNPQLKFNYLSNITWNEVIFKSFLDGNLKSLDLNTYFALETATARRLYRFLDKKFYDRKALFEISLFRLAYERLGMSRSRKYASQIKEKLQPAHDELVACGFLNRVEFREGQEGEVVVYLPGNARLRHADRPRLPKKTATPKEKPEQMPAMPPLAQQLIELGVGKVTAARFAKECPEEAERQLSYLPYLPEEQIKTTAAQYLTAAIRDGYGPPAAYIKAQKAAERQQRRKTAQDTRKGQTSAEAGAGAQNAALLESVRSKLSPEELEEIEREAVEVFFRQFPAMRRSFGEKMLDADTRRKVVGGIVNRMLIERYGSG